MSNLLEYLICEEWLIAPHSLPLIKHGVDEHELESEKKRGMLAASVVCVL